MTVPAPYSAWLEHALPGPVRGEPLTTCDACPLCTAPVPGEPRFTPDVKCCGYLPRLPNFQVGRALRGGGAGAASVRARIEARVATSPLGLGCPPDYAAAWEHRNRTTGFGSDPDLVCPHFDAGRCTIWAAREAVCTTWFCRPDRGAAGQDFWLALRALLQVVESAASRWALEQLGLDPTRQPVGWGGFLDDREALFLATAEQVDGLDWTTLRARGGFELPGNRYPHNAGKCLSLPGWRGGHRSEDPLTWWRRSSGKIVDRGLI